MKITRTALIVFGFSIHWYGVLIAMGVLVMKLNRAKGGTDTAWVPMSVAADPLPSPGRGWQGQRP